MKLRAMIIRNIKLFFKDKGMVFTSLITPIILLVLYATFLGDVYYDSFASVLPENFSESVISAAVASQLLSSILAVSCVTTAFCSNMLMVQDKVSGARGDLTAAPVKNSTLSMSYYISTAVSTLIICFIALGACLIYASTKEMYMTAADIGYIVIDVIILVLFGTALSSIVNGFLSSQGQMSAVGTIISAGYGFICGAYMPISQFGEGLQKVLLFLPGTYGTSLLRNHALRGVFEQMGEQGVPENALDELKKAFDCKLFFFDSEVGIPSMYLYMLCAAAALIAVYIIINIVRERKKV